MCDKETLEAMSDEALAEAIKRVAHHLETLMKYALIERGLEPDLYYEENRISLSTGRSACNPKLTVAVRKVL